MRPLRRLRERLVLGPVRRHLDGDEELIAWAHANVPQERAPAVLAVTDQRCLLHVASSTIPDMAVPLTRLSAFKLYRRTPELVRVRLHGQETDDEVVVELSLSNRVRSRSAGRVLSELTRRKIAAPDTFDPALTSPIPPIERSVRHHARRVWVTVLGVLVLTLSAVFASPFVPGPGALTAVAGIAILAREYEWARDLHVWAHRQAERFVSWMRELAGRRRAERRPPARRAAGTTVLEATVPAPSDDSDGRSDGQALAS